MSSNYYSTKLETEEAKQLYSSLKADNFNFSDIANAYWRADGDKVSITMYKSLKLLVQGKNTEAFVAKYINSGDQLGLGITPNKPSSNNDFNHNFTAWIGTDESGKGDFFGPLVIAGVFVNSENIKILEEFGIKDSKKLNDPTILKIAPKIKANAVHAVIVINPLKYNQLYDTFKNLNKLLAWGHARAIENILEKTTCENAISDKFGDESLIKNALMKNGRKINLIQRTKAEADLAVAAASILARAEFVNRMSKLESQYGMEFSKGASEKVTLQAKAFVEKFGKDEFKNLAKLHFKTSKIII